MPQCFFRQLSGVLFLSIVLHNGFIRPLLCLLGKKNAVAFMVYDPSSVPPPQVSAGECIHRVPHEIGDCLPCIQKNVDSIIRVSDRKS